jgi:diguanylate cyclase (GGDEF)-like protein
LDETFTVGVLSPLLAGNYYGGILKGVARAVASAGGRVVGLQTFDTGRDEAVYLRPSTFRYPIGWGSLSGFVVILNAVDQQYLTALRATDLPVVMISQTLVGLDFPVVAPDNRSGVRESVIHLIKQHGHRRIAFAGHVAQDDIRARYEAYQETLIEHGIEPDPRLLFHGTDAVESGGEDAARTMLAAELPSTAVVCGTDFNAIGVMRTLTAAGYHLPADQAVVGFDGVKAGKYVTPSLSTAEARFEDVGKTAGEVLIQHLTGAPTTPHHHSVRTSFLVRESCGCSPSGNAEEDVRTKVAELFLEETDLERTLVTQYQISMDLLRSHEEDPRTLEWLRRSRATSGCLGLWEGDPLAGPDPTLEIVGTFERTPGRRAVSVSRCSATAFPPAELIEAVERPADEIVYVVPVKMRSNDWGMLSFVGPVDTQRSVSLETMNQWAAVLSVALDRQAVLESLREQEEGLRRAALYDSLTGLPNRALFLERIRNALQRAESAPGYHFAVLFLDLDGFKVVNDSLGHLAGDRLLSEVADRISGDLREGDTAARFGGDEFAILVDGVADSSTLNSIARRLEAVIAKPLSSVGQDVAITASIGIAPSTRRYDSAEDLLRDADIAMYWAKTRDKGTHVAFDASMHAEAVSRLRTEAQLRRAIGREELELHYQPIVDLATGRTIAFEALLRWIHPTRGLLSPAHFLPVAEDAGLMLPIGSWVIKQVCQQLATWRQRGAIPQDVWVSLNLSNRQFWSGSVNDEIAKCLLDYNVPPECVAVEITESVIMHNFTTARTVLEQLHDQGLKLYVDDFGTGYSSLGVVHQLPIDALKIDRSFITNLATDAKTKELVRTIVLMGDNVGVDVIAEGIETEAQYTGLRQLGCRYGQGYWFSGPVRGTPEMLRTAPDPVVHGGQRPD